MIGRIGLAFGLMVACHPALAAPTPELGSRTVPVISIDGLRFKDLDRNGLLDAYEDWRLPAATRAADLVSRMTLEEKAGVLMHGTLPAVGNAMGMGDRYDFAASVALIAEQRVNSFISRLSGPARSLAEQNNRLQALAEQSRLGVPLTLSTDPRNHFQHVAGAGVAAGGFSKWPEALGFAAAGDPVLTRRFADIARQEYRAVGFHMALSPQADLATEPRWSRITGTFGEDADLAGRMVGAYVAGFQNGETGLGPGSVVAIVKHWVGYGAAKDGWDSHSYYGRYATFPSGDIDEHIAPFKPAFAVQVGGVMPTYSILQDLKVDGVPVEPVGAGFNRFLLTDLLRGRYGFKGVVVSDWLITNDCEAGCRGDWKPGQPPAVGMPWGVEDLPQPERFAKALEAGVDQFGGVERTDILVDLVKSGHASEARIAASARRILTQKFELGLFENPYVDPEAADRIVGSAAFQAEADAAQRRAIVLLENRVGRAPLAPGARVYLRNLSASAARARGLVPVESLAEAQVAIVRTQAPHQLLHPNYLFGGLQHEGDLDFKDGDPDLAAIQTASVRIPTYVSVFLDRPAILTNIRDKASVLLGDFGASDEAVLDVLLDATQARGRLPFELPSSMEAVRAQASDRPRDSAKPLYPFGYALVR